MKKIKLSAEQKRIASERQEAKDLEFIAQIRAQDARVDKAIARDAKILATLDGKKSHRYSTYGSNKPSHARVNVSDFKCKSASHAQ